MKVRGTGRWLDRSCLSHPRLSRPRLSRPRLSLIVSGSIWGVGGASVLARDLWWPFYYGLLGTALCALAGALLVLVLARILPAYDEGRWKGISWDSLPLWLPALGFLLPGSPPWRGPVLWIGGLLIWILSRIDKPSISRRFWLALAVGLPLAVYLPDLSPYVGRADTFEFQVVGPQLGIAHPSGYPLYTLISKFFSMLPVSTIAWRINLSSAIFAALAAGFLFLALDTPARARRARAKLSVRGNAESAGSVEQEEWKGARPIRLAVVLTLAFSPTLWSRAVEAEVYTLNACLVALCLWLVVSWHTGVGWVPGPLLRGNIRRLTARLQGQPAFAEIVWPALGLLLGLALASHITLGALAFISGSGLLLPRHRPSRRAWLLALGLGVLGVLFYAYIPLRWPAIMGGERMSLAHFWRFVTNAESSGALHPLAFYRDPARWSLVGRLLLLQVGWSGLALAAVGLVVLAWNLPALALGLVLAFAAWVWFGLSFYVAEPDYSAFYIPAHVLLVFLLGWGADAAGAGVARLRGAAEVAGGWRLRVGVPFSRFLAQSLLVAVFMLPLSRLWITGPWLDTRAEGRGDELWGRYVLGLPLTEGAAVLADSEKFPPLYYLQQIEGLRPDLELVTLFNEQQYREALEARLNIGQQVYLARYLPGMDAYGVSSIGPLVAVAPPSLAGEGHAEGVPFGEALVLSGYELLPDPVGRSIHHLTLVWSVRELVPTDLDVRLRLTMQGLETESVVWEAPARRPVGGYTTTQAWQVGWTVRDYHALVWPAWLPPGDYELEVALFPRFETVGLPLRDGTEYWHPLGSLTVVPPAGESLPNRHAVLLESVPESGASKSSLWLVASGMPGEVAVGSPLDLDLAWICRGGVPAEIDPLIWWVDAETGVEFPQPLTARGEAATGLLCPDSDAAVTIRRYPLLAPDQPGRYHIEVGTRDVEATDLASARCDWLGRSRYRCPITTVEVGAAGAGLATYAGHVLLREAEVDAAGVPAGGPLYARLRWRALEAMMHDYTVFVQLIGPDGQVYGQADSWPAQGGRPTSGWRPGEEVIDPHSFYVRPDGPSGDYRVIAGLYLLADMTRLPVIDAAGNPVADFYEIGRFSLP